MKLKLSYFSLILLIVIGVAVTFYMVKRARELDARMRREGVSLIIPAAGGKF